MCVCVCDLIALFRKPTPIEWKFTEEGEKVRVSSRTGRIIPKPISERCDGIVTQQWKGVQSLYGFGLI